MILRSIEANSFRNLRGRIVWGERLNVLYGYNGQGKTNWLEAIHLLALTKSFRTPRLQEAIKFGERCASISGSSQRGEIVRDLQITFSENTKQISLNGKRESISRYARQLHAVAFTADELDVVRGVPEARRKFLDRGVVSLHPPYAQTLSDYKRVIKQKNRLLQDVAQNGLGPDQAREMIAPWNEQLVDLGARIQRERTDYVARLNESFDQNLFDDQISIRYLSSLEGKGDLNDYKSLISDRLRLRLTAEMGAGTSLVGPHRDDLEIVFGGRDLRTYGSSGQQRSALITLDLAAISVYYSRHQDYPIFLIDDIDAELDENRIARLFEYLDRRVQTFVTTSKRNYFERLGLMAGFYEISNGEGRAERGRASSIASAGSVI